MKRYAHYLVGIIVLATVFTTNSRATTEIPIKELVALKSSQEARATFAEKLASFYRRLNDDIPNLKPSESEWLQKETERTAHYLTSTTEMRDWMELQKSREWHIARAKEQLDHLEKQAFYVATSIREYIAKQTPESNPVYLSLELKLWIHFSNEQLELNPFYHYLELVLHYDLPASKAMPLMGGMMLEGKIVDTPKQIAGTINKWIIEFYLSEQAFQTALSVATNTTKPAKSGPVTNSLPTIAK